MEKINKLKKLLLMKKIDGYLIPKNDEFFTEYVTHYNDRLNFISNFDGSYGFALIMRDSNYLFVDLLQEIFVYNGWNFELLKRSFDRYTDSYFQYLPRYYYFSYCMHNTICKAQTPGHLTQN